MKSLQIQLSPAQCAELEPMLREADTMIGARLLATVQRPSYPGDPKALFLTVVILPGEIVTRVRAAVLPLYKASNNTKL